MPNLYLSSVTGNAAYSGLSSFATAKNVFADIAAIDAAGDTILVDSSHSEAATTFTYASPGTATSPVRLISVNSSTGALQYGAVLQSNVNTPVWTGHTYTYGVSFVLNSAGSVSLTFNSGANSSQVFDTCAFRTLSTGTGSSIVFGGITNSNYTKLVKPTYQFQLTTHRILLNQSMRIVGASITGTPPTGVYQLGMSGRSIDMLDEGSDYSNITTSGNLITAINTACKVVFRNCKTPTNWTGALVSSGTIRPGVRVSMYNSDSVVSTHSLRIETFEGNIYSDTAVYRTSGATHLSTPYSLRMVSNSNNSYLSPLVSDNIYRSYPATSAENTAWSPGTSKTLTVYTITDGVTLTNKDFNIVVSYSNSTTSTLATITSDFGDITSSSVSKTISTVPWTYPGSIITPIIQEHTITITPQQKGVIITTLELLKQGTTVYVCPKVDIS